MKRVLHRFFLAMVLAGAAWTWTGCQAPDSENVSSRPWNSPTGWEHGLPTGLNEGR